MVFLYYASIVIANGLKINLVGLIFFCLNIWWHYKTDDAKANKYFLNLIYDQIIHILQIVATFIGCGIWMWF